MRFAAVSLLALLLLSPLVQRSMHELEEPLLIFVQDNSASLVLGNDSLHYKQEYIGQMHDFLQQAEKDFEVRSYFFGESFRRSEGEPDFSDRFTDISSVFEGIQALYSNRNIGAVVLASDGIFNRGMNPRYPAQMAPYPVYSIALGDTTLYRDALIRAVNHNRITYLGNTFPVEVVVEARQSAGASSQLRVSKNNQQQLSRNIRFDSDHHVQTLMLELQALEPGIQHYKIVLAPVEGEINLQNNQQEFFIEVIDGRQKVLILANSPHPDIGALKLSLESHQNYEVEVAMYSDYQGNARAFNLVIMHQLPSETHSASALIRQLANAEVPVLYILGNQSQLPSFNNLQQGLSIMPAGQDLSEAIPELNSGFSLFSVSDEFVGMLRELPPLFVPFASYQAATTAQVLFHQRIGNVITQQPLIMFVDVAGPRTGIIAGEGIWRWRLHSFLKQGSHRHFDELVSRMVQYLSLKEDKSRFRTNTRQYYYENDPVIFQAELYNASYELINQPEVHLSVMDEQGLGHSWQMQRTANAYRLDAGSFPPGTYTWESSTTLAGERFAAKGMFVVSALNIEGLHTVADHELLYELSQATGADVFYPGEWSRLMDALQANNEIAPMIYTRMDFDELINMKMIFFLILLLLSLEWFMRKRAGSY